MPELAVTNQKLISELDSRMQVTQKPFKSHQLYSIWIQEGGICMTSQSSGKMELMDTLILLQKSEIHTYLLMICISKALLVSPLCTWISTFLYPIEFLSFKCISPKLSEVHSYERGREENE